MAKKLKKAQPGMAVQSSAPQGSVASRQRKAERIDNRMDRLTNRSMNLQSRVNNSNFSEKKESRLLDRAAAAREERGELRKKRDALVNYTKASMKKGGTIKKKK